MKYEDFGGNERAEEQNKDRINGGYGGDYFDENEHRAGQEKYDLSTGKSYKNDTDVEVVGIKEIDEDDLENDVIKMELVNDPAEIWLRENDPNYKGFGELKNPRKAA
jgi:hypothetical protein